MKYFYKKNIFVLLFFFYSLLSAQEADSISNRINIDEVVVTSPYTSTSKATFPVQLLSIGQIDRAGITSISDAVRRFTGVTVKDYGGVGGVKTVSLRGFGAQHTGVIYDGIALNDALAGSIDIGRLSLDNLASLSLVHGQSDNIFQPARNFSSVGTLNIETQHPVFRDKNYGVKINVRGGSFGLFNPSLMYSQYINRKFSLVASLKWERIDGKYPFFLENGYFPIEGKRHNSDVNTIKTEIDLYGKLNKSDKLNVKAYYWNSDRGLPGAIVFYNNYAKERMKNHNFFMQAVYEKKITAKLFYKLLPKYNYDYMRYSDIGEQYPTGKKENLFLQQEAYLSNVLLYNFTDEFSLSFAQDFSYSRLKNDSTISDVLRNPVRKSSYTLLAAKYKSERLTVTGSLFATYAQDRVKEFDKSDYNRISPALAFSYSLLQDKNLHFRLSYKDIYRIPTLIEGYYKIVGTTLKPEKAKQINSGLTWIAHVSDVFDFIKMSVDVYGANVTDKIIVIPTASFSSTHNRGKVRMKGTDLNVQTKFSFSSEIKMEITGGYSFLEAIDMMKENNGIENKSYKHQIPYTPKHSGSAYFIFENPLVNFSYSFIASGVRYNLDQNIKANRMPSYIDHSVSVNKNLKIRNHSFLCQLDFLNILDKNYEIIRNYPMPGRSFRLSITYKF